MDRRQKAIFDKFHEADRIRRERERAYLRMIEFEFNEEIDERVDKELDQHYRRGVQEGIRRLREQEVEKEVISYIQDAMENALTRAKVSSFGGSVFAHEVEAVATDLTYQLAGYITRMLKDPSSYSVNVEKDPTQFTTRISANLSLGSARVTSMITDYFSVSASRGMGI